jgi:hypothetical protein
MLPLTIQLIGVAVMQIIDIFEQHFTIEQICTIIGKMIIITILYGDEKKIIQKITEIDETNIQIIKKRELSGSDHVQVDGIYLVIENLQH